MDVFMQLLEDKFAIRLPTVNTHVVNKQFTTKFDVAFASFYSGFSFIGLY
jgi:hypothetical protein